MSILRNAHVALSNLRVKGPTTQVPVGRSIHTVMTPPEEIVGAVGSKPEEWGERMGGGGALWGQKGEHWIQNTQTVN